MPGFTVSTKRAKITLHVQDLTTKDELESLAFLVQATQNMLEQAPHVGTARILQTVLQITPEGDTADAETPQPKSNYPDRDGQRLAKGDFRTHQPKSTPAPRGPRLPKGPISRKKASAKSKSKSKGQRKR